MPLNLSTKNREIWSPGSACEREQITMGSESPSSGWEGCGEADSPMPLELVKRCPSSPEASERPPSEPRRCPSEPIRHGYTSSKTGYPNGDLNISMLLKSENKTEKTFQVCVEFYYFYLHTMFYWRCTITTL